MQGLWPATRFSVSGLWERALDLVFPPRCVSCREFGAFLCKGCLAGVPQANPPRCLVCWMPEAAGRSCDDCRRGRPAFKGARSVLVYEAAAREAVQALKYNGVSALAPVMADTMAHTLTEWAPPVEMIVPVPLAGHRRRMRGYNQSALLAREVSHITGLPLEQSALARRRSGTPQVSQPDRESRRRNVASAFAPGPRRVTGGVLLIDDVMTTGATLDACARVLISRGAGPVFALTFARDS